MAVALAACAVRVVGVDVPIQVFVPASCGAADAAGAPVAYSGLGDFPQASVTAQVASLGSLGAALRSLAPSTREVVLSPVGDGSPWSGAALVPSSGPVALLALPGGRACPLSRRVNLAGDLGATLGLLDASRALLVGGTVPPFVIDLGDGSITQLPSGLAPAPPRDYATVTPFGSGALLAGGEDPTMLGQALETAVVYTPGASGAPGAYGAPIVLGGQRTRHAAVALPDGRTLLVGGTGDKALVTALEVLDPADPTKTTPLTATLQTGRVRPFAFALPTGQVFIGGGFDASGSPVSSVEWLAPDLHALGGATLCTAGSPTAFAPLEGGAVLAVTAAFTPSAACSNVHVLRPPPDGAAEAVALAPPPLVATLFAGAEARPVLLTDVATLRWDAWGASFAPLAPSATSAGLSLPTAAYASPSPGLALWLAEDDGLWVLRFDTHGPYATDTAHGPYLVTDALYVAPDRLPSAGASFSPATGAVLSGGATAWLTDATFASVTASVVVLEGGAVDVVLRDPAGREVTCPASAVPPRGAVQVVRSGSGVTVSTANAAASPCSGTLAADARVSVGVRAPPAGRVTVQSLSVDR